MDNSIETNLPENKTVNGMNYKLDKEQQVYYPDIEGEEPLGMYGEMLLKGLQEHNDRKFSQLMVRGKLQDYLKESNEACFEIAEGYMASVTEPEPEDFDERVQWNQRHSERARELAMEELNRRITTPYSEK